MLHQKAFRRKVEKLEGAGGDALHDRPLLPRREAGIEALGRDPKVLEIVNLVFHERDEGRNHDSEPVGKQGGELEAERLAPACGQDGERVGAFQYRENGLFLIRPELRVAPVFLERPENGGFIPVRGNLQSLLLHGLGLLPRPGREFFPEILDILGDESPRENEETEAYHP